MKTDPRVDAYIAQAADFAKPILQHFRRLVHVGCPDVEETIKWQFPAFMYRGMLCHMAAFKQHCTFGFWKHELILEQNAANKARAKQAMGQMGRITSLRDLPSDQVLLIYLKRAMRLNERGIKAPQAARARASKPVVVPPDLAAALQQNPRAQQTFENFTPSHKREYINWIIEAKRQETRTKRLGTTLAWLSEGKARNWKYAAC